MWSANEDDEEEEEHNLDVDVTEVDGATEKACANCGDVEVNNRRTTRAAAWWALS